MPRVAWIFRGSPSCSRNGTCAGRLLDLRLRRSTALTRSRVPAAEDRRVSYVPLRVANCRFSSCPVSSARRGPRASASPPDVQRTRTASRLTWAPVTGSIQNPPNSVVVSSAAACAHSCPRAVERACRHVRRDDRGRRRPPARRGGPADRSPRRTQQERVLRRPELSPGRAAGKRRPRNRCPAPGRPPHQRTRARPQPR